VSSDAIIFNDIGCNEGYSKRIIKEDSCTIKANIKNVGSQSVDNLIAKVTACPALSDNKNIVKSFELRGVSPGYEKELEIPSLVANEFDDNCAIQADACFMYTTKIPETNSEINIILGDFLGTANSKITAKAQGSPLNIGDIYVNIRQSENENYEVSLRLYVDNMGKGTITNPNEYASYCKNDAKSIEDANSYQITTALLGKRPMTCTPKKYYTDVQGNAIKGENYFDCKLVVTKSDSIYPSKNVPALLEITLEYGYYIYQTGTIKIDERFST
jgi:hypothetical protein